MADERDQGFVPGGAQPANVRRGRALLSRSLHALRARGNGTPLAGREAGRPGPALPGGGEAGPRVDDNGDARRPLVTARAGRLPARDRPDPEARLRIALPVKGRLREPSVDLLEHAGFA